MAIYLVSLLVILLFGLLINPRKTWRRRRNFIIFSFAIISGVAMLRKYTVGIDLRQYYYNSFIRFLDWSWGDVASNGYEAGYYYFNIIVGRMSSNPQVFIAIHALIVFAIYGWFIYRNSDDVFLSTFLVIAMNDWFMYMNIMRQAMAIAVILIAVEILKNEDLGKKRYLIYILFVSFASAFHNSALLMFVFLPMYLFKFKRKDILISICLILGSSLIYDRLFTFVATLLNHRDYVEAYLNGGKQDSGLLGFYPIFVFAIVFLFACYYLVLKRNKIHPQLTRDNQNFVKYLFTDDFLVYCILGALLCRLFSLELTIMGRTAYYFYPFIWIAIPRIFSRITNAKIRFILKGSLIVNILGMFLYTGFTSAGYLFGTVPYEFFWTW